MLGKEFQNYTSEQVGFQFQRELNAADVEKMTREEALSEMQDYLKLAPEERENTKSEISRFTTLVGETLLKHTTPYDIKELFENRQEIQPHEAPLEEPEAAKEARDLIQDFTKAFKRTPQFFSSLADNYMDANDGFVGYPDGDSYQAMKFEKIVNSDTGLFRRSVEYHKTTNKPDGTPDNLSVYIASEYKDDRPEKGIINILFNAIDSNGINTPSTIQKIRNTLAANFPESKDQTPPQK